MKRTISIISILAILVFILPFHSSCKKGNKIPSLKKNENFNLLLITVDSLRADRIGALGFSNAHTPNIDRMAENGVMFRNCYAPAPLSLPSHCTIFTSRELIAHQVRNNATDYLAESEQTWAEVMKNKDYETYALVSSYLLHSKFGLKQGFDTFDDSLEFNQIINNSGTAIAADKVFVRFQSWLGQRPPKRFFAWVNFSDPQAPYEPPQEHARMFEKDPYGGEVANVDHYIGEIMHALETKELLDRTVIVVAGSHGEALYEHREFRHGLFCYEVTLKVPLILYNPQVFAEKQVIERRIRLLDLLPSLLQLFNLESPAAVQGESFLYLLSKKKQEQEADRPVYFESMYGYEEMDFAPLTGIIIDNFKFISLPEAELYDLKTDPAELDNLAMKRGDLVRKMKMQLEGYRESHSQGKEESLTEADKSKKESQAIDPKKGVEVIDRMLKVEELIYSEKLGEAERELQGIRQDYKDWKLPQAYDYQYLIYRKKNNSRKVEETLRKAAGKYPEIDRFKLSLVQLFIETGQLEEAEKICLEELAKNPRLTQANILLGAIFQKKGAAALALSYLEKALEQEPQNARLQLEYASQLAGLGKKEKSNTD